MNRIALAILALSAIAAGCQPASTSDAAATPTPRTAGSGAVCQPLEPDCIGPLAAGIHESANLLTPIRFEVPDGWIRTLDVPGSLNLETEEFPAGRIAFVPDWAIAIQSECSEDPEPGVDRTVDDLVAFVADHPGLVATEPADVAIGGLAGRLVDISRNPEWSGPCPDAVSLFTHRSTIDDPGWWDIERDYRMRLIFLPVGEHVLTMHVETSDADSFDALVEAATSILASLEVEIPVAPADLGVLTLSADECTLEPGPPVTIASDRATLSAVNETDFPAAFDLWRIDDAQTFEDLVAHVEAERDAAGRGDPGLGHPGFVSGQISSGIVEPGAAAPMGGSVAPGTWAIVCLGHFDAVTDDPFRPFTVLGPITIDPS